MNNLGVEVGLSIMVAMVCLRARGLMSKITEPVAKDFICVVDYPMVILEMMLSDSLAPNWV